jgi:hypothetical protein
VTGAIIPIEDSPAWKVYNVFMDKESAVTSIKLDVKKGNQVSSITVHERELPAHRRQ